jgi:hypothetical protein
MRLCRAGAQALRDQDVDVAIDGRNEKIGFKIREAQLEKVPYMLVLGDKEMEAGAVAVRSRREGDLGVMSVTDFVAPSPKKSATGELTARSDGWHAANAAHRVPLSPKQNQTGTAHPASDALFPVSGRLGRVFSVCAVFLPTRGSHRKTRRFAPSAAGGLLPGSWA